MTGAVMAAIEVLLGLSGGLIVGSGLVSFLVILDLIPRLAQIARSFERAQLLETAVISGAMVFTVADFYGLKLRLPMAVVTVVGVFAGMFIGMLAAALTEVVNVLPILAKRLRMDDFLLWLLMAMVLGKVAGSLFDWIIYVKE